MNKLQEIFGKEKKIIIGALHFPPLLGYKDFPGFGTALKNARQDLAAFQDGGVDAVILENNYDIPHKIFVDPEVTGAMSFLMSKLAGDIRIPFGISVLWNDYRAALSLAKVFVGKFIRVPVFVDSVETNYGKITAEPEKVTAFRKKIGAQHIALFTDIHVKHARMLENKTITESAREAVRKGSDAVIITGKWTGNAPDVSDLKEARGAVGKDFPILVGSGADEKNIGELLKYANGAIISTALKEGRAKEEEVNVKGYEQRIDIEKVKKFTAILY